MVNTDTEGAIATDSGDLRGGTINAFCAIRLQGYATECRWLRAIATIGAIFAGDGAFVGIPQALSGTRLSNEFDRRYLIVAGALLVQSVVIGCMFAYGVFFNALEEDPGWSRTMLSLASSLAFLVMGVLAMFAGRFSDRYGPLWVLRLSALCTGIGYMLLYFLSAPWQLYLVFGVFVGLGLATHDVVTLSVVARHFEKRRGTMTGVVKVGTAIGQMSVPVVATWLILQFDWRIAFLALGAAATVLLFIAAQLMAVRPKRVASQADGQTLRHGLDFASARRTRQFWTLCAIQFCFFPSLMSIPIHIFVHGTDLGLDARVAATVISTIAGCSIAGRLTVGNLIDRIGARNALLICFVPLLCCLLFLLWISDPKLLFAFAAIYGFSHGGLFTVVSPTIAEFFGMRAHGSVFGTVLFFGTLGGAAGPVVCGWIYDSSGSYSLAFSILAALALTGLLLVLSLKPVSRSSETLQAN